MVFFVDSGSTNQSCGNPSQAAAKGASPCAFAAALPPRRPLARMTNGLPAKGAGWSSYSELH